jgi:calcineurin-like phosphoesterase family protein
MIEAFFTSDHHFGHKNILNYEKEARPFSSVEEMNEVMIERWNNVVHRNDIVYHLGDFAFGKHNIQIAERLNGKKRLILGNHDTYPSSLYLEYFDKLYGCVFWKRCVLSHMPIHPNGLGDRWILNIHGHLHSEKVMKPVMGWHELKVKEHQMPILVRKPFDEEFEEDLNYFNVSCEKNNLTPIHIDIIIKRLKDIDGNNFTPIYYDEIKKG